MNRRCGSPESVDLFQYAIWGPDNTKIEPSAISLSNFSRDEVKPRLVAAIVRYAKANHRWLPFNVINLDPEYVAGLDLEMELAALVKEGLLYYSKRGRYVITRQFITYCLNVCYPTG